MTYLYNSSPHSAPNFCTLYIFGAGGSGRETAWLAEQAWGNAVEVVFLVDKPEYLRDRVNGIPVCLLSDAIAGKDSRYVAAIGDPTLRRHAVATCEASGLSPTRLIHPRAEISRWAEFELGAIVCAGVITTTNVVIGQHVHVNLGCTISHDVRIGEFTTLSPGVHISGHVHIGRDVFIGTGASVINGNANIPLIIEDGAIVAAGACVTKPVNRGALVAGVPAVRKR
jgi:sugar O-acyltransferase (sialic acid O-acetyltransferase NeuD family)